MADTGVGSSVTFSGRVVHYTCDDTVTTDSSGNSNTGVMTGTGTTLSTGLINNKLTFNGSGYIKFTDVSLIGLASSTSEISVSCWITTSSLDITLLSLRNSTNAFTLFDFVLGYNGGGNLNTGKLSVIVRDNNNVGTTIVTAPTAINNSAWHHCVVTRTTAKLLTLYVDGASVATGTDTMTGALTPNLTNSAVGYEITAGGRGIVGSLDDFQIYNRALTSTEVTSIYNGGISVPGVTGTLTATEATDTAALSGSVVVSGALAVTGAADAAALSGAVGVTGALAVTGAADTAALSGSVTGVTGVLAVTGAPDTAAFSTGISGTLAATEAPPDSAALSGSVAVTGVLAVTGAPDTAALSGSVGAAAISGVLAATEAADNAALSGDVVVSGVLAVTEQRTGRCQAMSPSRSFGCLGGNRGSDNAALSGSVTVLRASWRQPGLPTPRCSRQVSRASWRQPGLPTTRPWSVLSPAPQASWRQPRLPTPRRSQALPLRLSRATWRQSSLPTMRRFRVLSLSPVLSWATWRQPRTPIVPPCSALAAWEAGWTPANSRTSLRWWRRSTAVSPVIWFLDIGQSD
jgi:hypothetical protein